MDQQSESLRDLLGRRWQEKIHQRAAVRGQLAALDAELADIHRAMEALGVPYNKLVAAGEGLTIGGVEGFSQRPAFSQASGDDVTAAQIAAGQRRLNAAVLSTTGVTQPPLPLMMSRYQHMKLRTLIMQALVDNFPDGATAVQLREFLRNAYGRDVTRESLSPQLSRLYASSILERGEGNTWRFSFNVTDKVLVAFGVTTPFLKRLLEEDDSETATATPSDKDAAAT